ncbi:MAG: hypothetical protein QME61_03365 [Patescibacteria group bacterium]|nr:hypothetical protein [Patescibacteria group bacterium]
MKDKKFLGTILFIIGVGLGIYASGRNCLIRLFTQGEMNFWTGIEILAGIIALVGLIIILMPSGKRND